MYNVLQISRASSGVYRVRDAAQLILDAPAYWWPVKLQETWGDMVSWIRAAAFCTSCSTPNVAKGKGKYIYIAPLL